MNDQILALVRTAWQAVIGSLLAWLLTLGIEVDSAAAFAVTWPIVMAVYYWAASQLSSRVPKLALPLTGPGQAPSYPQTYDEVIDGLTR